MPYKSIPKFSQSTINRFLANIAKGSTGACWHWTGSASSLGYGQFYIGKTQFYAHRVAHSLFKGIDPGPMLVCHSCDNPLCVNPDHLSLGDHRYNSGDMARKGRSPRGSKNGSSKLTEDKVLRLRALHSTGRWTQKELSKMFGLSRDSAGDIIRRRSWKHI